MLKDGDIYWELPDGTYKWANALLSPKTMGVKKLGYFQSVDSFDKRLKDEENIRESIRNFWLFKMFCKDKPIYQNGKPYTFKEYREAFSFDPQEYFFHIHGEDNTDE